MIVYKRLCEMQKVQKRPRDGLLDAKYARKAGYANQIFCGARWNADCTIEAGICLEKRKRLFLKGDWNAGY